MELFQVLVPRKTNEALVKKFLMVDLDANSSLRGPQKLWRVATSSSELDTRESTSSLHGRLGPCALLLPRPVGKRSTLCSSRTTFVNPKVTRLVGYDLCPTALSIASSTLTV